MNMNEWQVSAQPTTASVPPQTISEDVLLEKVARDGERALDDVRPRVAHARVSVERQENRAAWEETFYRTQVVGFIARRQLPECVGRTLIRGWVRFLRGVRPYRCVRLMPPQGQRRRP